MTNKNPKILIVDDESEIRNMLGIFLGVEDFEVIESINGKDALRSAISHKPDLILLDLGLPDMDGKEVITSLRSYTQTPIIVLTARSEDDQAVESLNLGADDYITKPFRVDVLLARIHANLRHRNSRVAPSESLVNGPVEIDLNRHEVHVYGKPVAFTPKEYDLLSMFVGNRGRIVTHKQILKDVWGAAHIDDRQYLRVYVGQVRDKLAQAGLSDVIVSEAGIGYRMEMLPEHVLEAAE